MGLFERLERGLERAVNGAFAKAFKSSVQPVEIASAMRRAMDDRAAATSRIKGATGSKATVPNMFTVELSTSDYDSLTAYADDLTDELLASAEEHIDSQRYRTAGPMRIVFVENTDLETGVFTVRPASARRPFELDPERLTDPRNHAEHGYEEFEELSLGVPVSSPAAKPTSTPADGEPEPAAPRSTSTDADRSHAAQPEPVNDDDLGEPARAGRGPRVQVGEHRRQAEGERRAQHPVEGRHRPEEDQHPRHPDPPRGQQEPHGDEQRAEARGVHERQGGQGAEQSESHGATVP